MTTMDQIDIIEKELQYVQTEDTWHPARYNLFVTRMNDSIEYLKNIIQAFSKNSISSEEQIIYNRASVLLQKYLKLWEGDFA